MATKKRTEAAAEDSSSSPLVSADADTLLAAAMKRGGDTSTAGRFLMTFKEGAMEAGVKHLEAKRGLRLAHAGDFKDNAVSFAEAAGADAIVFPEIHVALVSGPAAEAHSLNASVAVEND